MRILIAEDDFTSRTILVSVARKWGYDPIEAEDGEVAWQIMQQDNAPSLLLVDWEMPKLNGFELCKRIRQRSKIPQAYIIMLTARGDTKDIVSGLDVGANEYMSKPFDNKELEARLQVGKRMLELQGELKKARDVLASEHEVIENIILKMRSSKPFDAHQVRRIDTPVERTSGDILLSAFRPDKTRHLMLGDFTGHGLTAAVGGPIVYDIFYSMTAKNLPLQEITREINRQLLEKMPTGLFLGAVLIETSPDGRLLLWNCGMSDILVYRGLELWKKIPSSNLALGILEQAFDPSEPVLLDQGDRIYAYSDGITEIINIEGEEFGQLRLEESIHQMLKTEAEIDFLNDIVTQFRAEADQFDDITLVELTV